MGCTLVVDLASCVLDNHLEGMEPAASYLLSMLYTKDIYTTSATTDKQRSYLEASIDTASNEHICSNNLSGRADVHTPPLQGCSGHNRGRASLGATGAYLPVVLARSSCQYLRGNAPLLNLARAQALLQLADHDPVSGDHPHRTIERTRRKRASAFHRANMHIPRGACGEEQGFKTCQ